MNQNSKKYPECFGRLDLVFPLKEDGLRHTPETCMACAFKTACLRTAIGKADGLTVKEEIVDRSYQAGKYIQGHTLIALSWPA